MTLNKVAIIGVDHARFGVRSDISLQELVFEAVKPAFEDAGISKSEIELTSLFAPASVLKCYQPWLLQNM
jgi:acetyl-CoA acetyltransferase